MGILNSTAQDLRHLQRRRNILNLLLSRFTVAWVTLRFCLALVSFLERDLFSLFSLVISMPFDFERAMCFLSFCYNFAYHIMARKAPRVKHAFTKASRGAEINNYQLELENVCSCTICVLKLLSLASELNVSLYLINYAMHPASSQC